MDASIWWAITIGMMASAIRLATPLLLAGLGELLAERSGVVNIGIEGMMLTGAFTGAIVAAQAPGPMAPWVGWAAATAAGVVLGGVLAWLVVRRRTDQVVTGLAINLFGLGLTGALYYNLADSTTIGGVGFEPLFSAHTTPGQWPVIGPLILQMTIPFYLVLILLLIVHLFLFHTRPGLHIRACGENPAAVDTAGLSVTWIRSGACLFAGGCAGAAGGFLSLAATHSFVDGMTGGIGFVALALVIFGHFKPLPIAIAALLFGFLSALKNTLQALQPQLTPILGELDIDRIYPAFSMLPYLLTLLTLAGIMGRARTPAALGVPYHR